MTRVLLLTVAAIALAGCSPPAAPTREPTPEAATPAQIVGPMVGVLEDRPGASVGEAARFVIRALFEKTADGWRAFPSDCSDEACLAASLADVPAQTAWTVSFDGASLGQVTSRAAQAVSSYADIGRQELASSSSAPSRGERTMEFAGWTGAPVYRPLVATSGGGFVDPDAWSAATLTDATVESLRKQFRAQFPNVQNCASPEANAPRAMSYKDSDIVVSHTHASSAGWSLATLNLVGYKCDGPMDDTAFAGQTFATSPAGEIKFVGAGLLMVDAGDFDADGRSEVLLAIDRYNRGGYELHTGDFASKATFAFGFH